MKYENTKYRAVVENQNGFVKARSFATWDAVRRYAGKEIAKDEYHISVKAYDYKTEKLITTFSC